MRRQLEPIDLMVAIGVFATVIGGYFMFMSADGVIEGLTPASAANESMMSSPTGATQWVQPALGQAIVDSALIERSQNETLQEAVRTLNRTLLTAQYTEEASRTAIDDAIANINRLDADHAARVQYVLGRAIAIGTARGVRSGLVEADAVTTAYNHRLIETTEAMGNRMASDYMSGRESRIGWAIVDTTRGLEALAEEIQPRLGTAVVGVLSAQEQAMEAKGAAQTQLALVALASIHDEEVADRFGTLAMAERPMQTTMVAEARSWPETPVGWLTVGSLALIGVFVVGLFLPIGRPEPIMTAEQATFKYRKTA